MAVVSKSILSIPYNRALNWFAYPLGGYTYLANEDDVVQVYACLPGYTDPDTSNDWYKVLDQFDPDYP